MLRNPNRVVLAQHAEMDHCRLFCTKVKRRKLLLGQIHCKLKEKKLKFNFQVHGSNKRACQKNLAKHVSAPASCGKG